MTIARKGTGPGAGGAKPKPEPYWLKKLRVDIQREKRGRKLKRKTNRGTSRQSGR